MASTFDNRIVPECYIDTNLIEAIAPTKSGYNHQKGCPAVAKKMKETFADGFAVGVMDKDKRTVSYLKEFDLVADDGVLFVYKHASRPHYIVMVSPAAEEFILGAARELDVDLAAYGVPTTLEGMKKETKQVDAKASKKYRDLFKRLSQAKEFSKLSRVIEYLKSANYGAQVSELVSIIGE